MRFSPTAASAKPAGANATAVRIHTQIGPSDSVHAQKGEIARKARKRPSQARYAAKTRSGSQPTGPLTSAAAPSEAWSPASARGNRRAFSIPPRFDSRRRKIAIARSSKHVSRTSSCARRAVKANRKLVARRPAARIAGIDRPKSIRPIQAVSPMQRTPAIAEGSLAAVSWTRSKGAPIAAASQK